MLQARRALFILISVVALVVGFMPAAFARPGMAAATPSAAPATAARASAGANTAPAAAASQSLGYWLIASDGGVFSGGDAVFHGSTGAIHLASPIVGIASTPSGNGYWAVASDGGIFAFGDAAFHGSTGAIHLHSPIVGIAPTPSGHGYWLVASDGGIFAFGDAAFHGSTGAMHLNKPIVGIATTPSGHGYWLVASDGGIFAFGDAAFHGSTGAMHLNQPIVGIGSSPSGHGYRMVASDGGVFSFGDAAFYGSTGAMHLNQPIVGMAPTASGHGYWFVAKDGGVFSFGDAGFFGSAGAMALTSPIVGMVATAPVPDSTKLAFSTQPGDSTGGLPFATQPVVTVEDATGARAAHDTSTVHLSLTNTTIGVASPPSGTLGCDSSAAVAVAGVASFSGCEIDHSGTYTLTATDGTLASAVSETVTITVGAPAELQFTTQPTGAVHGVALTAQPSVSILDAGGNLTAATSSVVLTLTTPGAASLSCAGSTTKTASGGVANFNACAVDTIGDYSLTATDGVMTEVSSTFQITNLASQIAFTTEPSATAAGGTAFAIQPVVTVQDSTAHTIVANASNITLTITVGGATVACTANPKAAASGVATFAGCKIPTASGTAYTLTATGAGFTAVSTNVLVSVGAASQLVFTQQPSLTATGGTNFVVQPKVTVEDAGGNTVTGANTITLTLTNPAGAVLTCNPGTDAQPTAVGIATFGACSIDKASVTAYTLHAAGAGLTGTSTGITVSAGVGTHVAFTVAPSATATGGTALAVQPTVTVLDAGGNAVVAANTITLTLNNAAGAVLTCTGTVAKATAQGVAAFNGCAIDKASATAYTITATDTTGGFTATSGNVLVSTGVATHIAFTVAPSATATGGTVFGSQPTVTVLDAGGNTVTTPNTITLSLNNAAGAALTCNGTLAHATVQGVAAFTNCAIDLANATAYTITATATTGSFTVTSGNVLVSAGVATHVVFTVAPSATATGGTVFGSQPTVTALDAGGNPAPGANTITLSLNNAAGATLTCTGTLAHATAQGVAAFTNCAIDLANATAYTITATATTGGSVTSGNVLVSVGAATHVAFTVAPSATATGGTFFGSQPTVTVLDAGGNTVIAANTITLSLNNASGAVLTCAGTLAHATAQGVAAFTNCAIDKANVTAYTITATATTGAFTVTSGNVLVSVGAATQVAFTVAPSATATGGTVFASQPTVTIEDAGGNTVVAANTITLSLNNAAGAVLTCTGTLAHATGSGVAAFTNCAIDKASATAYTITATATTGGFTATSNGITVSVGSAAKLAFSTQPGDSTGGVPFATAGQPVVVVQDLGGNTVTTGTASVVHMALTNANGGTLTCAPGTNNQTTSSGVATFAGCSIDVAASYTLTATDPGSVSAVSVAHPVITVGTAVALKYVLQPVGSSAATNFPTQPHVAVVDAGGNTVTSDLSDINLVVSGTGGGVLSCTPNPQTASGGVAVFGGCQISLLGTYTITANDVDEPGLGTVDSNLVTIS